MLATHKELERKLITLEQKYDEQFSVVFEAIRQLMIPPDKKQRKIGFEIKEPKARCTKKKKAK